MKRLYFILLSFLSVISYGQVTVLTDINAKEIKLNDPLVLTIVQEVVGENMEQQTPLRLPDLSKFDIIGNASEQNTFIDQKKGIRVNQIIYQLYLQPKTTGKIKIGSALLTVNGKIYKSEPFDVLIKEADKRADNSEYFSKDVFLNLDVEDKEVYENQPVVAVLRAYSKNFDNFRKIDHINVSKQPDANIKPVSYKKQDIENTDGEYTSQVIATFVIFPEKSGNVEIKPISALVKSPEINKITSNKVKINVKMLPKDAPADFKDAVGKFNVSINSSAKESSAEVGKPIDVAIKISGLGNLDVHQLPKIISSKDYTFFNPKITSKLITLKEGVKGSIVAKYVLIPKREGAMKITTEGFAYFSPELNKYIDLGSASFVINVLNSSQIEDRKTTLDLVDDYTKGVMETVKIPIEKEKNVKHYTFNIKYILINFSVILGGLFLLFWGYKLKKRLAKTSPKKILQPITTVSDEEERIRKNIKPDFNAHLEALFNLKKEENYKAFFNAYDDLYAETELYIQNAYNANIKYYLEKHHSAKFNEEFGQLLYAVSIEKYAPIHDAENMENLYQKINKVYSEIMK